VEAVFLNQGSFYPDFAVWFGKKKNLGWWVLSLMDDDGFAWWVVLFPMFMRVN